MSRKRVSRKCKASYIFLVLLFLIVLTLICMIGEVHEHFADITEYRCREAATEIITDAVARTISSYSCDDIYTVTKDKNGSVVYSQLNTDPANRIKNILTREIESDLEMLGDNGISIPLGTLLGIPLFSGNDATIQLEVQQLGSVKSEFRSNLESAGINQTRLTVYTVVTVDIRAILPDGHRDISVKEEYLIADCIFVGDIPQTYISGQ